VDEGMFNDSLLAFQGTEDILGEAISRLLMDHSYVWKRREDIPVSSISHGKCSRARSILSLNNLVATKLHSLNQCCQLVLWNGYAGFCLAKKWDNSLAGMTPYNRDCQVLRIFSAYDLGYKSLCSDDIQSCDSEEALSIEDSLSFEDFSSDGNGGVDGVRDDKDISFGSDFSDDFNEPFDNSSVDVEEIVAGHSRFACSLCLG